jgi:hypothetical protein
MQVAPPPGPFSLTISTITYIPMPIYEPSTITFNDDIKANVTADIIEAALTKIESWCPRSLPTYSAVSTS